MTLVDYAELSGGHFNAASLSLLPGQEHGPRPSGRLACGQMGLMGSSVRSCYLGFRDTGLLIRLPDIRCKARWTVFPSGNARVASNAVAPPLSDLGSRDLMRLGVGFYHFAEAVH